MHIKKLAATLVLISAVATSVSALPFSGFAQNSNSSTGQMKESGSEVAKAGKSMGRNVRHGRIVRGGKHFGKHMGRAGRHFGRGTKKAIKHVVS